MGSPRTGTAPRTSRRRLALWSALSLGWLLPSVGCQVEYAGMTLPSGKYMHDDVQYFQPGPDFPWSNTQAATQRARMQAMGFEPTAPAPGPLVVPVPPGAVTSPESAPGGGPLRTPPPPPAPVNAVPGGGVPAVPAPAPGAPGVPAVPPPIPAGGAVTSPM